MNAEAPGALAGAPGADSEREVPSAEAPDPTNLAPALAAVQARLDNLERAVVLLSDVLRELTEHVAGPHSNAEDPLCH